MADQEVIKHTKKVVSIWGNKETSFWHKLKDFIVEILIIVFAVSISIWLHNWSEHSNEQHVTRTFLLGLREDIRADTAETNEILKTYREFASVYSWLSNLDPAKVPNRDSLKKALTQISSTTFLRVHKSRFDGFLSAGKIMTIENDSLTQDILQYYEEVLTELKTSEDAWTGLHNILVTYLIDNNRDMGSDISTFQVLTTSKGKFLTKTLIPWPQLLDRYQSVIMQGGKIISAISTMYPDKK